MVKIAPSILSADFCRLGEDIEKVSSADWLHVDVMDGMFVPNISIGVPVVQSIRKHTRMFLDTHLMVEKPERYVGAFAKAGADLLTVHLEADMPPAIHAALDEMENLGVKRGIALRPITGAEAVLSYLEKGLDLILVMTVEPGFGGQAFMADQLPKITAIRKYIEKYCPSCHLEVDGGINAQTARQCVEAGADVLVAGSAVYGAADIPAAIAALRG
ncbi:MAG: ribulose-phosphate 3-epimerase [Oscillospiraceae bacterium]|nr:ribulose-phosphate 3-epimerase [Oscillospiraceae bacterium]